MSWLTVTGRAWVAAVSAALAVACGASAADVRLRNSIGGVCPDCDFSGQVLEDAPVIGNLPRSDFSGAILTRARIGGNFVEASFARADLTGATIQSVNFTHADFSGAKLDGAVIAEASFFGADFTGATLRDVRASASSFVDVAFVGARMGGAALQGIDLSRSTFTSAELPDASLTRTRLIDTRFDGADLRGADLTDANASGASFAQADLNGAVLTDANLSGADLSQALGLTPDGLAAACGDADTRLPLGFALRRCADPGRGASTSAQRRSLGAPRDGAALVQSLSFPPFRSAFAPPDVATRRTLPTELGAVGETRTARLLLERLAGAEAAVDAAYTAAYGDIDVDARDRVAAVRVALAELDVAELINSEDRLGDLIEDIASTDDAADTPAVRAALADARRLLSDAANDVHTLRADLAASRGAPRLGSADDERLRRATRLARSQETRERRLDREFEARLRALEAACADRLRALTEAPAGEVDGARADCRARETAILAERAEREAALVADIDTLRTRAEAEISRSFDVDRVEQN